MSEGQTQKSDKDLIAECQQLAFKGCFNAVHKGKTHYSEPAIPPIETNIQLMYYQDE